MITVKTDTCTYSGILIDHMIMCDEVDRYNERFIILTEEGIMNLQYYYAKKPPLCDCTECIDRGDNTPNCDVSTCTLCNPSYIDRWVVETVVKISDVALFLAAKQISL